MVPWERFLIFAAAIGFTPRRESKCSAVAVLLFSMIFAVSISSAMGKKPRLSPGRDKTKATLRSGRPSLNASGRAVLCRFRLPILHLQHWQRFESLIHCDKAASYPLSL